MLAIDNKDKKETEKAIVDKWLIEHFRNKLKMAITLVAKLNRPLTLYSKILEESEDSAKEIIMLHTQRYITVQIFVRGGFIPTTLQEQQIFTIDKFISWVIEKRRDREIILQCLEALEKEYVIIIK